MSLIGALTLGIAGIGLMNIMLVSGQGADARDWRGEGAGGEEAAHPPAISLRGLVITGDRRGIAGIGLAYVVSSSGWGAFLFTARGLAATCGETLISSC